TQGRQKKSSAPLDDGYEIYRLAQSILETFMPLAQPVRLLGVSVSSLVPGALQDFLFQALNSRSKADQAMDEINREFGARTLRPAATLTCEKFGLLDPPIPPSFRARS